MFDLIQIYYVAAITYTVVFRIPCADKDSTMLSPGKGSQVFVSSSASGFFKDRVPKKEHVHSKCSLSHHYNRRDNKKIFLKLLILKIILLYG